MKSFTEKQLQEQLQKDTPIPDVVEKKVHQAYLQIQSGQISQEEVIRSPYRWMKKASIALGCAAAAFFFCMILFLTNPVMAENLPGIGSLFSLLQDKVSFFGNFEDYATPLQSQTEDGLQSEDNLTPSDGQNTSEAFSQTYDGLTITLSEVYADPLAVYLTVLIENEEPFPGWEICDLQGKGLLLLILLCGYA